MADEIVKTYRSKTSPSRKEPIEVLRREDAGKSPTTFTVKTRTENIFVGGTHDVQFLIETLKRSLEGK